MKTKIFLTIALMLIFNVVTFGYTPPDCDGCAVATPGFQYETYDGHCMYIENYRCDLEGAVNVTAGDDDPTYGIDMGYVTLNGCDGYKDTSTLSYTKRWGSEYSINLGFEVEGLTVGGTVTSSYEEEFNVQKPVECPACKEGDVKARSTRRHATVVVTVKSYRRYDKVVRTTNTWGFCARPFSWCPIVRQTAFSKHCETSQYNGTGYVYGMAFPEEFEDCPTDESGCQCVVLE